MSKEYVIPVFVPHLGCPNDCIFCNQKSISGQKKNITKEEAKNTNYNKEKVDDYNYVNKKDVSMSFSFTIANGDSLINLATELMNDNPVLKEIYSTPNALASDMAKQNKMTPSLIYPGDYNLTVNTTKKIADEYNIKTSTLSK